MQAHSMAVAFLLGMLAVSRIATAALLRANSSQLQEIGGGMVGLYGKNACRCVGIDNLKGYYAETVDFYHTQYPAETGASCAAWEDGRGPCADGAGPAWCKKKWCYVDPCSCDLAVLPSKTKTAVTYQGSPAYWSYDTCGDLDLFSQDMSPDACKHQKSAGACSEKADCAWDGKQCGGKELINTCKKVAMEDETVHGQEDCRCVGLDGRDPGKAFMHINDKDPTIEYDINVGSTCQAWEEKTHPDCLKDGPKPDWCSAKWCFVDPCKCKAKVPPKAVMEANHHMRFQGKTAYWSYAACGSTDSWSKAHAGEYCVTQKSEAACSKIDKCAWDGRQCLGKALVEICKAQEETGILGMEAPLEESGASGLKMLLATLVAMRAFLAA